MAAATKSSEDLRIFCERLLHFLNLWTVYTDMLAGKYLPMGHEVELPAFSPKLTMTVVLYAYFYSLVDESPQGINAFRIWRRHFPEEKVAIDAMERQVKPFLPKLKIFRNRLGFHGSSTRSHEAKGFELFSQHSGTELWNAMRNFKSLASALFAKDTLTTFSPEQVREWIDAVAQRSKVEGPS